MSRMEKTVFISSTYEDLAVHRQAAWQVLEQFHVAVQGMEQFGARKEAPLVTCLAEVEQCDIYVGIVAFRLGSIEAQSGKSYTQLEYEHALRLGKEIWIYLADERAARFRYSDFESDQLQRERVAAFRMVLTTHHTASLFSTPEDLAEKLKTDFARYLQPVVEKGNTQESEFDAALALVRRFNLLPGTVSGREVRMEVSCLAPVFPASRALCKAFNLEYGRTIGAQIRFIRPMIQGIKAPRELYASGLRVDDFMQVMEARKPVEIYARLQFTSADVPFVRGEFFGYEYNEDDQPEDPPGVGYVSAEGKATLLFSKVAI